MATARAAGWTRTRRQHQARSAATAASRPKPPGARSPPTRGRRLPPGRHLRPRPIGVRRPALRPRAADPQARPRLRPHPPRRHRRRRAGGDAAEPLGRTAHLSTWPTTTPAETAAVMEEAARLLSLPPPPAIAFADAAAAMSPMARSFWAENRKVASRKTQAVLRQAWRYPSYREGLRAILRRGERPRPGITARDPAGATGGGRRPSPASPARRGCSTCSAIRNAISQGTSGSA